MSAHLVADTDLLVDPLEIIIAYTPQYAFFQCFGLIGRWRPGQERIVGTGKTVGKDKCYGLIFILPWEII